MRMVSEATDPGSQKHDMRRKRRLEFPDQLMFRKVMEADNGICEAFIELVLGFPVERIERKAVEDPKNATIGARGVRLDVFVKGSNRMIDLEMQASEPYELGKRMRYYQGSMDVSELKPGEDVDALLESHIIFVCKRDPFGFGVPRYELEPRCAQAETLDVGADMHWLVLNAEAFALEENAALRRLLQYISCGTIAEDDPLVRNIAEEVDHINDFDEEVKVFWTLEDEYRLQTKHKVAESREEGRAEGKAEGRAEGREEGRAEGLLEGERLGEERYAALVSKLLEEDRAGDINRIATDKAYRKQLLKEFGLA